MKLLKNHTTMQQEIHLTTRRSVTLMPMGWAGDSTEIEDKDLQCENVIAAISLGLVSVAAVPEQVPVAAEPLIEDLSTGKGSKNKR